MNFKTKSFLRREEYKRLSELSIDGPILDVGGSKNSGYHELIKGSHNITTGNIDPSYGIDIVFDAQDPWPFSDFSFSGVLFMNILEHLYRYQNAVDESFRVLKYGGIVTGVVPFMLNIHGTPHDHFRFTRVTLERMFKEAGFTDVQVEELGTGAFSIIYQTLIGFVFWNWEATILMAICRELDALILTLKPNNKLSKKQMPLGYYFEARKRSLDQKYD